MEKKQRISNIPSYLITFKRTRVHYGLLLLKSYTCSIGSVGVLNIRIYSGYILAANAQANENVTSSANLANIV